MGLIRKALRQATPRPVRQVKSAVTHPVGSTIRAVTPGPVRSAHRTAFNATHPINAVENIAVASAASILRSSRNRNRRTADGQARLTWSESAVSGQPQTATGRAGLAEAIAEYEAGLFSLHLGELPDPSPRMADPVDMPDFDAMRSELEASRGVPALREHLEPYGDPPIAPAPSPVDRREICWEVRNESLSGIPWWQWRARHRCLRQALVETDRRVDAEERSRREAAARAQRESDARAVELAQIVRAIEAEARESAEREFARRAARHAEEQAKYDEVWERLCGNDAGAIELAMAEQFSDDEAVQVLGAVDATVAVIVEIPARDELIPDYEPAITPTGRLSVQSRSLTRRNDLYRAAIGGRLAAVVRQAFAAAPNLISVTCVAVAPVHRGELVPVYVATFGREASQACLSAVGPDALLGLVAQPRDAKWALKGRARELVSLDPANDPRVRAIAAWLSGGARGPDRDTAMLITRPTD